jgi:hypothetical protein
MAKRELIKRILPYTDRWERLANNVARSYSPPIHPCVHCGYPVVEGYCCEHCGSALPGGTSEEREEFEKWYLETMIKKQTS